MRVAILSAVLAATAFAAPLQKRQSAINDYVILQYALTLENLENTFYQEALSQYSADDFTNAGFDASVRTRIEQISSDEMTHVSFLSSALTSLGQSPVQPCTYAFGYTDVKSFLATSSILEGVGVSAYLGAAASIMDKTYLTAAGAILTIESRHSSYIRNTIGESPFPEPFDTPLDFNEVYSLASLFITSCPSTNVPLPVKAFPKLTATLGAEKITLTPDSSVTIPSGDIYAVFIGYPTNQVGIWDPQGMEVWYPYELYGQVYCVLSTSQNVTDDTIIAGPTVVELTNSAYAV